MSRVSAVRSSKDGKRLITISLIGKKSQVLLWDVTNLEIVADFSDKNVVFSAKFVARDHLIVMAGPGGAQIRDAWTGKLQGLYPPYDKTIIDVDIDPSGSLLVTGDDAGIVAFWEIPSARLVWTFRAHRSRILGLHFAGDDLVTRGRYGDVARWRLPSTQNSHDNMENYERLVRCLPGQSRR